MAPSVYIVLCAVFCFYSYQSAVVPGCGRNERNPGNKSVENFVSRDKDCNQAATLACDACWDCSPCVCKFGYIRASAGGPCITHKACRALHEKWLHEAKYEGKTDNFCQLE